MERNTSTSEHIANEAAEWFMRLQDEGEATGMRAQFAEWMLRSPTHVEEFLAVSRIWGDCDAASSSTEVLVAAARAATEPANVVALRAGEVDQPVQGPMRARALTSRRFILAAAAVVATLAIGLFAWSSVSSWLNPVNIRTAVGEQRSVVLADGSVIYVNTKSRIHIDMSRAERRIRLLYGEARFKVARDPQRPFIVETPLASVRALGTVFNVRADGDDTQVAVLEGHVELRQLVRPATGSEGPSSVELKVNERASISRAQGILADAGQPIERAARWTERRLVFREETIASVIAEFNRYHERPIRIEDPELAGVRISGTFDSSDVPSLLEYFERFEHVRVEQDENSTYLFRK